MRQAVIVIGCSYGDEGKGLAAAWHAGRMKGPCLNVLINGGAQRGHTADLADGRRHVFHHFGSASFTGADSYADEDFIANPLLYAQEAEELMREFGLRPRLILSDACRVSTPFDMMMGQIIEENRGKRRHGSCGCGIYETILRFRNTPWALRWNALKELTEAEFRAYCRRITVEYLPGRLAEAGAKAGTAWEALLRDEGIAVSAWADLQEMKENTENAPEWETLAARYPSLIFEAGQGLALDEDNRADFPHLTPSHTTSLASARRIAVLAGKTETEICYVTRSYLTRHGAGPLPGECPREQIGPGILDRTNTPNPHQQTLRYAPFDGPAVLARVRADLEASRAVLPGAAASVLVTHLNETKGQLKGNLPLSGFLACFDRAYGSDCPWKARRIA